MKGQTTHKSNKKAKNTEDKRKDKNTLYNPKNVDTPGKQTDQEHTMQSEEHRHTGQTN